MLKGTEVSFLDVETAAGAYMDIKAQIKELEEKQKVYRDYLEMAVKESPDMRISVELYEILLTECSRESCDLKAAKAALGDAINPFIKKSEYTQLRITKR